MVNNRTLAFNRSDATSFSGLISGSGDLQKVGAGSLTLTGNNTYSGGTTISAGTLQIGNGGTSGLILGDVANNGTLAFNRSDATSFSGLISGSGDLQKLGAGSLTLSANSSFTGSTTVENGILIVNGSIERSPVEVKLGATLGGTGKVGGLTVYGTLAPGNSPGTITVNGNLRFMTGSFYNVEFLGENHDRVNATGSGALNGTIHVTSLGVDPRFDAPYTVVHADGGINGTFTSLDKSNFGNALGVIATYDENNAYLTLERKPLLPIITDPNNNNSNSNNGDSNNDNSNSMNPASLNARSVAAGLDKAGAKGADLSPLIPIYALPDSKLNTALESLSGDIHTELTPLAINASRNFSGLMLDHGVALKAQDEQGLNFWTSAYGSYSNAESDAYIGTPSREHWQAHTAIGMERLVGSDIRAGLAFSYGQGGVNSPADWGTTQSSIYQFGAYCSATINPVEVFATLSYGVLDTSTDRNVNTLANPSLSSSYIAQALNVSTEIRVPVFKKAGFKLSPLAGLEFSNIWVPGFVEQGRTPAALGVNPQSQTNFRGELGLRLDYANVVADKPINLFLSTAWAYDTLDNATIEASMPKLEYVEFKTRGTRIGNNVATGAIGFDVALSEFLKFTASCGTEISTRQGEINASARFDVKF